MPGFDHLGRNVDEIVDFLLTGKDTGAVDPVAAAKDPNWLKYRNEGYILFRDPDGYPPLTPPWGTLNAIDLNKGEIRWQIPFGEYPELAAKGMQEHRQRQLWRPGGDGERAAVHRRHQLRQEVPRLRQADGQAAVGRRCCRRPETRRLRSMKSDGREYVVIVCGGGKNGAPSGGSIVAFALPGQLPRPPIGLGCRSIGRVAGKEFFSPWLARLLWGSPKLRVVAIGRQGMPCDIPMRPIWNAAPPASATISQGCRACRRRESRCSPATTWPLSARGLTRDTIAAREPGLWRWRELLPVPDPAHVVSLGEAETPLIPIPRSERPNGFIVPAGEGRGATADRLVQGAWAVSRGVDGEVFWRQARGDSDQRQRRAPRWPHTQPLQAWNPSASAPMTLPRSICSEIAMQGARVWRVNGLINDCAKLVQQGKQPFGWFDMSTLKEPYRIEGKKTMGLELAIQGHWQLPDVVFYPTGGGTGLIGMWKAWQELQALGWISGPLPRLVAVQSTGCAPIVRAFDAGATTATFWENAHTIASGIRVPGALGDFLILRRPA